MSTLPDETVVMITRKELFRLLTKAARIGSESTAYSGQLDVYDFVKIAYEVLDESKIPAVADVT